MLFNNIINLLSGLKDLKDNGKDNALAIINIRHLDLIRDNKMVVFCDVFE